MSSYFEQLLLSDESNPERSVWVWIEGTDEVRFTHEENDFGCIGYRALDGDGFHALRDALLGSAGGSIVFGTEVDAVNLTCHEQTVTIPCRNGLQGDDFTLSAESVGKLCSALWKTPVVSSSTGMNGP